MTKDCSLITVAVGECGIHAWAGPLVAAAVAFRVPKLAEELASAEAELPLGGYSPQQVLRRAVLDEGIRRAALGSAVVERAKREIDVSGIEMLRTESIRVALSRCIEQVVDKDVATDPRRFRVLLAADTPATGTLPFPVDRAPAGYVPWELAAAAIVARSRRDSRMLAFDQKYPEWALAEHMGDPLPCHRRLLAELGPSPVHRATIGADRVLSSYGAQV
jgi:ribonuclease HII